MTKILWGIHEGSSSGAIKCFLDYAILLKNNGYEIRVLLPVKGLVTKDLDTFGLEYTVIPFYGWTRTVGERGFLISIRRTLRNIYSIFKIAQLIKNERIKVCCTNTITFNVLAIAASMSGRKHIWFDYEFGKEDHGFNFKLGEKFGYGFMHRFSDYIVTNSYAVRKKVEKFIGNSKLRLIRFPLIVNTAPNTDHHISTEKINLILMGQIAPSKGHSELLEALYLSSSSDKFNVHFLGSVVNEEYDAEIRHLVNEYNLNDIVKFHGYIDEPYEFLKTCDFMVMASRSEAYSRVVLEALLLGIPVIGKNTGGTPEQIINNYNGFIYKDSEELTKTLNDLFSLTHVQYQNLCENSLKYSEIHTNNQRILLKLKEIIDG